MREVLSVWARRTYSSRRIILWLAISFAMALSGPFGTFWDLYFHWRLVFWLLSVGISMQVAVTTRMVVHWLIREAPPLMREVAATAVFAMVYTPIQVMLNLAFALDMSGPLHVGIAVFLVALLVLFVRRLVDMTASGNEVAATATVERAQETLPRLLERLEPAVRGEVLHVSVRDHYVDVATRAGTASLLLRFADAMAELKGEDGLQVHRSHWVGRGAILGLDRTGGRLFLRLCNGAQVPVSRSYREEVEALDLPDYVPPMPSGMPRATLPVRTATGAGPRSGEKAALRQSSPPV